ncbi:RDD family protein [Paenibacillus xylaniclasticus]|uniref:RDD family protein n=1 Tax=Paenibacillus xylaniclasticus TaxID=588083 RepID=UPI000FDBB5CF|nr:MULTISPECIES: RDD family protein [Paenibacillus]GFN31506.1 hypothetical protein PCURB6_17660 [Paenibacillus curdlanolyticus]
MDRPTDQREESLVFRTVPVQQQLASYGGIIDANALSRETDVLISFLRRFAAFVIDRIVIAGIIAGGLMLLVPSGQSSFVYWAAGLGGYVLAGFLYFWLYEARSGATVGKWMLRIRVVNREGRPLGWKGSFIRNVIRIAEFSPFMLSGLAAGILVLALPSKQRLGDMAADAYVLPQRTLGPLIVRKSGIVKTLFIALFIAGVTGVAGGITMAGQWFQSLWDGQTFQTADGRYEITVPAHWDKDGDIEAGLFINSYISNAYIYIEGASDEEQNEFPTLIEYASYVGSWITFHYSAVYDDYEPEAIELNGNSAYRYMMHAVNEEGTMQSYTVTITGDEERYYFIVAALYDVYEEFESIEEFRRQHRNELNKLDRWVGSFRRVLRTVTI